MNLGEAQSDCKTADIAVFNLTYIISSKLKFFLIVYKFSQSIFTDKKYLFNKQACTKRNWKILVFI